MLLYLSTSIQKEYTNRHNDNCSQFQKVVLVEGKLLEGDADSHYLVYVWWPAPHRVYLVEEWRPLVMAR